MMIWQVTGELDAEGESEHDRAVLIGAQDMRDTYQGFPVEAGVSAGAG